MFPSAIILPGSKDAPGKPTRDSLEISPPPNSAARDSIFAGARSKSTPKSRMKFAEWPAPLLSGVWPLFLRAARVTRPDIDSPIARVLFSRSDYNRGTVVPRGKSFGIEGRPEMAAR